MQPSASDGGAGHNSGALIRVVAAVIRNGERYLLCQRPRHKRHGGLWEFPGGKMLDGETAAAAVCRELDEELGVASVFVGERLASRRDEGSPYVIEFYPVEIAGIPQCREHEGLAWMTPEEARAANLAPSDQWFVERIDG